jgi:decaprenyl-phosphate phosphoribosyltransferase
MNELRVAFLLTRPAQWAKNLFLFIPMFFAGEVLNLEIFVKVLIAFFAFSCASSSIYIVNDLRDMEEDRQHPEKCKRPLAAGLISSQRAWFVFTIFLAMGIFFLWLTSESKYTIILASYFLINLGYSFGLKRVPIVEMLIISSGFVLRVIGGGFVAGVQVSQWMVMMVFLLALFLALAKRRDDFFVPVSRGKTIRKSIEQYNLEYINSLLIMISGIIIVSYLMYVISPEVINRFHAEYLYLTSVFVIAGIMRYLQIALVENKSGSPTRILYKDNFIKFSLVGWIISFYIIIYRF